MMCIIKMSFFPEKSTVERIKKLENTVRILQRQVRELQQVRIKSSKSKIVSQPDEDDGENCTIS